MAEDQGVNGTIWNKEATKLLTFFGWESIGDYDMDVVGEDSKKYGIDTLMKFSTPLKNNPQSVILEAKRYETKNFNSTLLQEWINRLDTKLVQLKNSVKFVEQFPDIQECSTLDLGIIAIWFHDIDNYYQFHPKFIEFLRNIKTSNKARKLGFNKVFVIDNYIIIKLCALDNAITKYENELQCKIEYYYPSILINDKPIVRGKSLTPEYIFSKIILAEAKGKDINENLVFYFGELETNSFKQLRNLLTLCSFLDNEKSLTLFVYHPNDDFRKIEPDIKKLFGDVKFKIKMMDNLYDLPSSIKEISYE